METIQYLRFVQVMCYVQDDLPVTWYVQMEHSLMQLRRFVIYHRTSTVSAWQTDEVKKIHVAGWLSGTIFKKIQPFRY